MPLPLPHFDSGSAISALSASSALNSSAAFSFRTLNCELSTVDCRPALTPIIPAHTSPPEGGIPVSRSDHTTHAAFSPSVIPSGAARFFPPRRIWARWAAQRGTVATNPVQRKSMARPKSRRENPPNGRIPRLHPRQRHRCSIHRRHEFSGTPRRATQVETRRWLHETIRRYPAGLFRAARPAQVGNPP
jgi:hypothetical protein